MLVDDDDPMDAHDDLLKPGLEPKVLSEGPDTAAQPNFLAMTGVPSMSMSVLALVEEPGSGSEATELGLAILMPCAAAILRSSFSSRLRSFSLRLSTSSLGLSRALACMSLKRALWWCAYELVCSSYWATVLNCFSHSWQ